MEDVLNLLIDDCKQIINTIMLRLQIINEDFLSEHLICKIDYVSFHHRGDSSLNKYFRAHLDDKALDLLNLNDKSRNYNVSNLNFSNRPFRDKYLSDLFEKFDTEGDIKYFYGWSGATVDKSGDEIERQHYESLWKTKIKYYRNEHLRCLICDLLNYATGTAKEKRLFSKDEDEHGSLKKLRNDLIDMFNERIPNNGEWLYFADRGLLYKFIDLANNSVSVRLVGETGLFGEYIHYGRKEHFLEKDKKEITIPRNAWSCYPYEHHYVCEISKNVFESLQETEVINIPDTIQKLEWSFWHCRKLRAIEVYPWNNNYCSIDGVLYSYNKKILYAYPNMHGNKYEIPKGVEIIEKFAFKDCDNIDVLILPSTLKHIKVNAFYRAIKLKKIICKCPKNKLVFDGFQGNYGDVNPEWIFV